MKNISIYIGVFWISIGTIFSQDNGYDTQQLFEELKEKDSLIFNLGFNEY